MNLSAERLSAFGHSLMSARDQAFFSLWPDINQHADLLVGRKRLSPSRTPLDGGRAQDTSSECQAYARSSSATTPRGVAVDAARRLSMSMDATSRNG